MFVALYDNVRICVLLDLTVVCLFQGHLLNQSCSRVPSLVVSVTSATQVRGRNRASFISVLWSLYTLACSYVTVCVIGWLLNQYMCLPSGSGSDRAPQSPQRPLQERGVPTTQENG